MAASLLLHWVFLLEMKPRYHRRIGNNHACWQSDVDSEGGIYFIFLLKHLDWSREAAGTGENVLWGRSSAREGRGIPGCSG
jgi:hypothetical protein